jgi:hypothetical protein
MPTLCSCGCGGTSGKCKYNDSSKAQQLPLFPELAEDEQPDQPAEAPSSPATPFSAPD